MTKQLKVLLSVKNNRYLKYQPDQISATNQFIRFNFIFNIANQAMRTPMVLGINN
ncbi:hypothetical protein Q8W40_23865 [Vibrio penaeicida]|uniref:hypothetical protein n=1 Tax=Vibrio penaeicida TaxID=104609 RepID=UPI00273676C6|nr:hypothetical protein [Vibrio penaeicida]MDP2575254.1 hypothetical protein [Vibrio penaeicida]